MRTQVLPKLLLLTAIILTSSAGVYARLTSSRFSHYIHHNCSTSLSDEVFDQKYQTISSKFFEETRMMLSKELVDHYCITSAQLNQLMGLLSFDRSRMELASYAIGRVADVENFSICKQSFAIPGNQSFIDELLKEHSANSLRE